MDVTRPAHSYPLRVEGTLDRSLRRWLWLVKWLLAIPHFIALAFLWAAFVVMSVAAISEPMPVSTRTHRVAAFMPV